MYKEEQNPQFLNVLCFCNTTRTAFGKKKKMRTESDTNDAQNLL